MPPKTSQKRSRESTGTATKLVADAATAAAVAAPGSAPLLRRGRSSSVTSQEEGNADNEGAPRPKRSKRERNSGRESGASDASMGEEDMDEEGKNGREEKEQDVGNGRAGSANASSKRAGAAKKSTGGRRRASAASAAVAGGGPGEAESSTTTTQPPAGKRSRKSTGSSTTTTATAATPVPAPPGSQQVGANVSSGAAGAIPPPGAPNGTPRQPLANGRHPLAPGSQRPAPGPASSVAAAAATASGVVGVSVGGKAAGSGRPPLAASAPRGRGGRAPLAVSGRRSAGAGAGAIVSSSANGVVTQASPAAGTDTNSPGRGVSPSILRRITGSAEESPKGALGGGGGSGGGHGDATGVVQPWRAAVLKGKAWARKVGGCVPEIDIGAALPAVQILTMRCLLLLVMLLGARVVWTVTLMATGVGSGLGGGSSGVGGGRGDGGGGGRERVQGGATRREAALSLVRESETFRSLEGALAERGWHLAGMEEQGKHAHAALEGLRGLVHALDDQMELLRDQAAGGVASRGLPDDPQVSESVSLSQLAEVRGMEKALKTLVDATSDAVEEGQKWTDSAVEDLEKLSSSSPSSSSSHSSTERREAAAEAAQTWDADFARTFEAAFLGVESVIAGIDTVGEMGLRKPGAKEGAQFARRVQEAAVAAAASGEGWGEDLQQRVEAAVAKEIKQVWGDLGAAGEDTPSSVRGLETAQEAEDLVAHEVEIFSSGGTGMPDYASLIPGASVVYGPLMSPDGTEGKLTSSTLASTMLPWADYVLHLLRMPGRVYAEDGDAALSTSNSLGSCFAFQGGEGRLTVKLARPPPPASGRAIGSSNRDLDAAEEDATPFRGFVKVTHVSIEHARTAHAPSATKSAPRAFRVLGWDADPSVAVASTSGFGRIGGGGGDGSRGSGTALRPYVLVEGAEYSAGGDAPGVQTFAASDESRLLAPPVGWVTLEVQSNHGGKWTCVYGFRVHGDPVV